MAPRKTKGSKAFKIEKDPWKWWDSYRICSEPSKKSMVYPTRLLNHCLRLSRFRTPWKEAISITLSKPGTDPKFPQYIRPMCVLSFGKATPSIFKDTLLKETRFMHIILAQVPLHNISTATVILDIEKAFHTTWHHSLLCKWWNLQFWIGIIELIALSCQRENSKSGLKTASLSQEEQNQGVKVTSWQ
jgi:hypothetical protein